MHITHLKHIIDLTHIVDRIYLQNDGISGIEIGVVSLANPVPPSSETLTDGCCVMDWFWPGESRGKGRLSLVLA
uniref:Uncharacterized protein n=1 Tax=Parascaris univalens TaxID=6257 RepID=A0A914ZRE7_PARUN